MTQSWTEFLTRKTPPCPCEYDEGSCGGQVAPDFIGPIPDGIRAVYRCYRCGYVWDHEGQPLRRGDSAKEVGQ